MKNSSTRVWKLSLALVVILVPNYSYGWGPHIHIGPIDISPLPLPGTPPIQPTVVNNAEQKAAELAAAKAAEASKAAANAAAEAAKKAADAAAAAAKAQAAIPVAVAKTATGNESVGQAAGSVVSAQAKALEASGQLASTVTEQSENVKISVATSIAGDPGKTVMTLGSGADRLQQEFASTLVIQSGQLLQGANASQLLAAPLAAAIRAAQSQFAAEAKTIPADVKEKLAAYYTPQQLDAARYAVGALSISIPDIVNKSRKTFEGYDNAVTVGNVMVFSVDPAQNYHWWAHELQHTNQYATWGIDKFAYTYLTSCHAVEQDAEDHAQKAVPYAVPVQLSC